MTTPGKCLLLFVLLAAPAVFTFCQKKMFGRITVEGWALDDLTKQPLKGMAVKLLADDAQSARSLDSDVTFDETTTDEYGHFELKSKPSKGDEYNLLFQTTPSGIKIPIKINSKGRTNLGEMLVDT